MSLNEDESTEREKARRHEEVYAKPDLPRFAYYKIDERMWHGRNPLTAKDVDELRGLGITHILDLREAWEYEDPDRKGRDAVEALDTCGIVRGHVPVRDAGAPSAAALEDACTFLKETLAEPGSCVYIHCRKGAERTGAVLVAFHASMNGVDYDAALQALQAKGARIQPLSNQERVVKAWLLDRKK